MPGGATSSSQEGALKQGYIHLLPYMLRFLAGTRKVVRYHDVTPGSQITWNTAFLAVTGAYRHGGEREVRTLLSVLEAVVTTPEEELSEEMKRERLILYRESNDAFRQLLLGRFGRLPLGFPQDWVYESAFGSDFRKAIEERTDRSPLFDLKDIDIEAEQAALANHLGRDPSAEELVMYLNHPGDALKTIEFKRNFGDPNTLPLDVWFEGLEQGQDLYFYDSNGKPHHIVVLDIAAPDHRGMSVVRYMLDSEFFSHQIKVAEASAGATGTLELADRENPFHVASPSNGDLWVTHVKPGQIVRKGEELFNISIMKQEKAVLSPMDGMVKRVLKFADYLEDKKMVPVKEGELLIELTLIPRSCPGCANPLSDEDAKFCSGCGMKLSE
jgi:pyruvate carboxylase